MLPRLMPDDQQEAEIARMLAEPTHAALVASDTGAGKTLVIAEFAKRYDAQTILLIAPANRKVMHAWRDTFTRQGVTLPFVTIDAKTLENFEALRAGTPGIYYVSRQFFGLSGTTSIDKKTKEVKRKARWSWGRVKPDLAVFDEVQLASNRDSTTYEALKTLKHARYRVAASATPGGNKFSGLWSVCRWLWADARDPKVPLDPEAPYIGMYVDNSFWRWAAQWATTEHDPFVKVEPGSGVQPKKVTGEMVEGAFVNSLPCYIRTEVERIPVELRKVYVDLTERQRKMYDQMEADLLTWIDEHPLVADLPIVQRIRLRQMTLGEVTFNDVNEIDFADDCESSKIDALEKIISKYHPNDPIFILTDSQKFARVVAARLGPKAAEYSGRTTHRERERIVNEFGRSVQFLVSVIPAVAEGLDGLQHVCKTEVWLSQSLNEMLNEQARGRVNRRGQKAEQITRYHVMARDTDDDGRFQNLLDQHLTQRRTLRRSA